MLASVLTLVLASHPISAKAGLERLRQIAKDPQGLKPSQGGKSCIVYDEITSKIIVRTREDRRHANKILNLLTKRVKQKSKTSAPTWIGVHAAKPVAEKLRKEKQLARAVRKALKNHLRAALRAAGGWRRRPDHERVRKELELAAALIRHAPNGYKARFGVELNKVSSKIMRKLGTEVR